MISPLEGNGPRPWVLLDLHRPMLFKIMDEKSVLLCACLYMFWGSISGILGFGLEVL